MGFIGFDVSNGWNPFCYDATLIFFPFLLPGQSVVAWISYSFEIVGKALIVDWSVDFWIYGNLPGGSALGFHFNLPGNRAWVTVPNSSAAYSVTYPILYALPGQS